MRRSTICWISCMPLYHCKGACGLFQDFVLRDMFLGCRKASCQSRQAPVPQKRISRNSGPAFCSDPRPSQLPVEVVVQNTSTELPIRPTVSVETVAQGTPYVNFVCNAPGDPGHSPTPTSWKPSVHFPRLEKMTAGIP